jgi:hypothetical protein
MRAVDTPSSYFGLSYSLSQLLWPRSFSTNAVEPCRKQACFPRSSTPQAPALPLTSYVKHPETPYQQPSNASKPIALQATTLTAGRNVFHRIHRIWVSLLLLLLGDALLFPPKRFPDPSAHSHCLFLSTAQTGTSRRRQDHPPAPRSGHSPSTTR